MNLSKNAGEIINCRKHGWKCDCGTVCKHDNFGIAPENMITMKPGDDIGDVVDAAVSLLDNENAEERYQRAMISKYKPNIWFLVSKDGCMGALAKWAVKQSPYPYPENLEKVLAAFGDHIDLYFDPKVQFGFRWFKLLDLENFIDANLKTIPEYRAWNERKNGRDGNGYTSVMDIGQERDPDDDFIDLGALVSNICHDIYSDNVGDYTEDELIKYTDNVGEK